MTDEAQASQPARRPFTRTGHRPAELAAAEGKADPKALLPVVHVAAVCHRHPTTIERWIKQKRLPAVWLGRSLMVRRCDLDAFLEGLTKAGG